MINIYDTPAPSNEELEKRIMMSAPVDWLKLQEDIIDPDIDTKMSEARNLTGESKSLTLDELTEMRKIAAKEDQEERSVENAYATVVNMLDSLKVLATEDPHVVKGFFDALDEIRKIAKS
jgi:hypothetical protein